MQLGAMWALVRSTDWVTTFILFGLIITYFVCCSLSIYKWCMLRREIMFARTLSQQLLHVRRAEDITVLMQHHGEGALHVCDMVQESLHQWQMLASRERSGLLGSMSEKSLEQYAHLQEQVVEQHSEHIQAGLSVLSISAAASPLIGLFGTIWGLIHAFINIGVAKSADLAVIAPGVAEALLTTLAGLIVAIPALVFYHCLAGKARDLEQLMWRISDRLTMLLSAATVPAHTTSVIEEPTPTTSF